MGLNQSSVSIRNWLHKETVRMDFSFDSVSPVFGVADTYSQALYIHIVYMMLLMIICLIIINYIRKWSREYAQITKSLPPLPRTIYTKVILLVLPYTIITLCVFVVIAYLIAYFVSIKMRRRYGNTAFTVIRSIYKAPMVSRSLNKVMDIVLQQYYILGYLIDRIKELFVSTIKQFDFAAARTAGQVAPSYSMLKKLRDLNFYSLIFGPVVILGGVATGIMAAVSTISDSYVLQGIKFYLCIPAMMIWWVIAGLLSPVILAMADVCMDPVQSVITVVEKNQDEVNQGLVAYYLECKDKNPVEKDLTTMKSAIDTVESYVINFKGKIKARKMIASEMIAVTEFYSYLVPSCDWSQRAFALAVHDLCRTVLVSYYTMWVCAIILGILLTALVLVLYFPRLRPSEDKKLKADWKRQLKEAKEAKFNAKLAEKADKLRKLSDASKKRKGKGRSGSEESDESDDKRRKSRKRTKDDDDESSFGVCPYYKDNAGGGLTFK